MEQLGLTVLIMLTLVAVIAGIMVSGWLMARYQRYWPIVAVLVMWMVSWYWAGQIIRERKVKRQIMRWHSTNEVRELERKK